jgi:methylenetetrahydrofolate dehydrogenase (NAD+)
MATILGTPASCKVVLAPNIAKGLLAEVSEGLKHLDQPPHLLGILANADPSARLYAEWTEKTCREK